VIFRIVVAVLGLVLIVLALRHPAPPTFAGSPSAVATAFSPLQGYRTGRRTGGPGGGALVYVVGAVARPGLYHLGLDARAVDAVKAAGGFTARADPVAIDLAAFVRDGDELIVPAIGQSQAQPRARSHRTRRRHARALPSSALDVNAATADDLAAIPGIGRAVAQRIVDMRERLGPFGALDELLDVAGMTDERLERARPFLTTGKLARAALP
jgi:competence protein ComEA